MCLGIPGQIIAIKDETNYLATVDVVGVQRDVNITCVVDSQHTPADCVGDWVLVHVGFAMSRIDPQAAQETLQLLEELGELQNALESRTAAEE